MEISDITIELMFDRIKSLEKQVDLLQNEISKLEEKISTLENAGHTRAEISVNVPATPPGKRDTTKYMLNGNVYLKNRLVLAVVRDYVSKHPYTTRQELKTVFDKTLQGSIGVVENEEIAKLRSDYEVRFFTKPEETLALVDGKMYVCTQWGILNIPKFVARAKKLGYDITEIK